MQEAGPKHRRDAGRQAWGIWGDGGQSWERDVPRGARNVRIVLGDKIIIALGPVVADGLDLVAESLTERPVDVKGERDDHPSPRVAS